MERQPAIEAEEEGEFENLNPLKKVNFGLYNHTPGTDKTYSYRLSSASGEVVGPAKSLAVNPGDIIDLEVFAKYNNEQTQPSNASAIASALIGAFQLSTAPAAAVIDGAQAHNAFSTIFNAGPFIGSGVDPEHEDAPRAYLNYILFDEDFVLTDFGFDQVSTDAASGTHEQLSLHVKVQQKGYLYIYLSNENPTLVDVYFDDFKVLHHTGVEGSNDYYPFGLTYNSYSRENSIAQDYLYNGKEKQDELGLGWCDYGARIYMSDIGRWGVIDPMADKYQSWSPYDYVMNNPLKFTDPTGMFSTHTDDQGKVVAVYDDGDNSVYRHEKNADGGSVTQAQIDKRHEKSTSGGGEKMGETEYWDEFIVPGTTEARGQIYFGDDQAWEPLIEWGNERATKQGLEATMEESKHNQVLDIKTDKDWAQDGPMTGRLLNGKYATARSAGNYLAGMSGVTATIQNQHISGETYMKLAGAYQQGQLDPY